MQEWMEFPAALNRTVSTLEQRTAAWLDLLWGMYTHEVNPVPLHIRKDIAMAMKAKQIPPEV
jgi:hypothetical protein